MSRHRWIIILILAMLVICVCVGGPVLVTMSWPSVEPAGPTPVVWTLEGPPDRGHGLWAQDALFDEHTPTLIGEIVGGTRITPGEEGCYHATWDSGDPEIHPGGPYVYCHVRVLDGDLAGAEGWVGQEFIRK